MERSEQGGSFFFLFRPKQMPSPTSGPREEQQRVRDLLEPHVADEGFDLVAVQLLVVGGVALNRINVFLVAYQPPYATSSYFPSVGEIVITVGLIATLMFLYRVIVTVLPVFPVENASQLAAASIPDRDKILSYANPEKCPYAQPVQSAGSDNLHTVPCRGE